MAQSSETPKLPDRKLSSSCSASLSCSLNCSERKKQRRYASKSSTRVNKLTSVIHPQPSTFFEHVTLLALGKLFDACRPWNCAAYPHIWWKAKSLNLKMQYLTKVHTSDRKANITQWWWKEGNAVFPAIAPLLRSPCARAPPGISACKQNILIFVQNISFIGQNFVQICRKKELWLHTTA